MFKAKRAIIMAAGEGTRMRPVTEKIPKPLVSVQGIRMIDSVIQALRENGITEIYIVTGYLEEQFVGLKETYAGVELIHNPYYHTYNNISSLYMARKYIPESLILDGDQMIYNSRILNPYFERSGYCAVWCEQMTKEWLMTLEHGIVTACSREGGSRGYQLYSVSFWNEADGRRLSEHIREEFEDKQNYEIYWDDVAMFCHSADYRLGIREIKRQDIVEIDSLEELIEIDAQYERYRM